VSGLLTRLFERREHPSSESGWERIFGMGSSTPAGVEVTVEGSLASAVVYACVRVLAESIAMLPLITYRRMASGGKERADDHALYPLLHDSPNPEMTSFEWQEVMIQHCATWGNHFSEIEWSNGGMVTGLWPLRPDRMALRRARGALVYEYWLPNNRKTTLRGDQVLHVRFMGNGLWGESPIRKQMNSIGLDLATEEFGSRYFSNGARPSVILKHPGRLSDEAHSRLTASWEDGASGLANAHRTRIIEEGMDIEKLGIPPEEAQFLETRKFQRSVIAGWYRVPPHLVGDLERATFSNIEQQALEFEKFSLAPWLKRIDQRMGLSLLTPSERRTYYLEHLVNGLMWGDSQTRSSFYSTMVQIGVMSPNEVRTLENLNPYEGGDEFLRPLNMGLAGEGDVSKDAEAGQMRAAPALETRAAGDDEDEVLDVARGRQRLARSMIRLFEDSYGRVVRREVADLRRAVNKYVANGDLSGFMTWLVEFYADLREAMPDYFRPVLESLSAMAASSAADELGEDAPDEGFEEFIEGYLRVQATGYVSEHENRLRAVMDGRPEDELEEALEEQLDRWEEKESSRRSADESVEATNALVVVAYTILGVRSLRWNSVGDSCPFCARLDGQVIGISGYFVEKGATVTGAGGETLVSGQRRRHGPLHDGCDCVVTAA